MDDYCGAVSCGKIDDYCGANQPKSFQTKNRVPHCKECNNCKKVEMGYTSFYCEHESLDEYLSICVDDYPKTSPSWCPKRTK